MGRFWTGLKLGQATLTGGKAKSRESRMTKDYD